LASDSRIAVYEKDFQLTASILGATLIFYLFFRAGSNRMRVLSQSYPLPNDLVAKTCGVYPFRTVWWFYSYVRVSVNSEGLALSQILIPFIWHVRAFVPWEDAFLSEDGNLVKIGAVQLPSTELTLNRVVLSTMQHRLNRKVPFGHIL
jgi:hypothetical protein